MVSAIAEPVSFLTIHSIVGIQFRQITLKVHIVVADDNILGNSSVVLSA